MHRVRLISAAVLLTLMSGGRAAASAEPFEDYAQNIHPRMVHYCAECHSRTSSSSRRPVAHSDRDPAHAYPIFLGLATAPQFANSRLFTRIKNEHYCFEWGENCDQQSEIERDVLGGVRSWLERHQASLSVVQDGAQTAVATVPPEADASFTISLFGPRQAWGAPEVRATVRAVLGSTYRLDRLELRGSGGTWRVRDIRVSVNGAPVFASALSPIDFRATLARGMLPAFREAQSAILFERPLGTMVPGQSLTLSARIEPVESRESCHDLEIFETFGRPWILSEAGVAAVISSWMGTGWRQVTEALTPGLGSRADVLDLCNRFAERLSPAVPRSPLMADFHSDDRLMVGALARAMMSPPSWLIDVLRAPKAKFESVAHSNSNSERTLPSFACGRTAEGELHCWGGRFGSRPQTAGVIRAFDLWPTLDPQEAGRRRVRFPEPVESFALSESGLVCAIGRSTGTVWCAGHVERPSSSEYDGRTRFDPGPLGANFEEPREAPFWNTISGDRPAEIAASRDNFCVRMQSGRVFCHGPAALLRGLGSRPDAASAVPVNRTSTCGYGSGCDFAGSIFSSLTQRPIPVPIEEPVDTLLAVASGFCAVKGARAYCWGVGRLGGLVTEADFELLENRPLQIADQPVGSRRVAGSTSPQRPTGPPQFLRGRLFAEPIKKIVTTQVVGDPSGFYLLTESGRLNYGTLVRRVLRGPLEDALQALGLPDASDFVVPPRFGRPCILTKNEGRISCPIGNSAGSRYFGRTITNSYRDLNLVEPQKQLVYLNRSLRLCGLGASDGQVRCLNLGSESDEGESGSLPGRLRHLMGFGNLVPDVSLMIPIFLGESVR